MIISQSRRHTYTVRVATFCLAGACVLLLFCTQQAMESASEALALWWTRVLPALFPFYVLTSMLHRLGAFARLNAWLRGAFLPCLVTGAAAGNPTGARIAVLMGREEYAAPCNLCSPMFLLGVVSVSMCGNADYFWPLAIAHYGSALLLLPLLSALPQGEPATAPAKPPETQPSGIFADIGGGMLAMLNIGGCIVFFYVLANTLLTALMPGRLPTLSAVIVAGMEMTAGCARIASLALPPRVIAGMLAFAVTFGGLCVFAQTMITTKLKRPAAYLAVKVMQGCIAGILAYCIAPLFLKSAAPAWSSRADEYAENALIGLTFLLCAGVGLVATYLMALLIKRARAGCPGAQAYVNNRRRPRRRPPR